jgi:hypothetical protein
MKSIYKNKSRKNIFFSFLTNIKTFLLALLLVSAVSSKAAVTLGVAGSASPIIVQSGEQFIYTVNFSVSSLNDVGNNVVLTTALLI